MNENLKEYYFDTSVKTDTGVKKMQCIFENVKDAKEMSSLMSDGNIYKKQIQIKINVKEITDLICEYHSNEEVKLCLSEGVEEQIEAYLENELKLIIRKDLIL